MDLLTWIEASTIKFSSIGLICERLKGYDSIKKVFFFLIGIIPFNGSSQERNISLPIKRIVITSSFGNRIHPISGKYRFHYGIDLSARSDTIFSVLNGEVKEVGRNSQLGKFIKISHGALTTVYGHLSAIGVHKDQKIKAGQPMAITGKTGLATGEHLHFSLLIGDNYYINPLHFLLALENALSLGLPPIKSQE